MQILNWPKFCLGIAKRSKILQISDDAGSTVQTFYVVNKQLHGPNMPVQKAAGFLIGKQTNKPTTQAFPGSLLPKDCDQERKAKAHVQSQKLTQSTGSLAFPCQ